MNISQDQNIFTNYHTESGMNSTMNFVNSEWYSDTTTEKMYVTPFHLAIIAQQADIGIFHLQNSYSYNPYSYSHKVVF